MNKIVLIIFLFVLGCSEDEEYPIHKELMSLETLKAAGRKDRLFGRVVWVYGYLINKNSRLMLYPNESLTTATGTSGAFVGMELNYPVEKLNNSCLNQYVSVTGTVIRSFSYYDLGDIKYFLLLSDSNVDCIVKDIKDD